MNVNVVSFVNERNEISEREMRAKRYSAKCNAKRNANRIKSIGFLLLGVFEVTAALCVILYYVFIG